MCLTDPDYYEFSSPTVVVVGADLVFTVAVLVETPVMASNVAREYRVRS